MAHFLRHTGCSHCGSSDAYAHYSDGSTYCFSCGWTGRPTTPDFKVEPDEDVVPFPDDLSHDFPEEVAQFIKPTGLTYGDLIANQYYHSFSAGGLVRILNSGKYCGSNRRLRDGRGCYEVRLLYRGAKGGPKSQFYGSKEICFPISKEASEGAERLVLVEDSLSAIKVGRCVPAMPLFGSTISKNKLLKTIDISKCQEILVWLDADKWVKAQEIASQVHSLGLRSRCIYSDDDPKYQSDSRIKELLQ